MYVHVYSDLNTRLAAKFVESRLCAGAYAFQVPNTCTDLDPILCCIAISRTYSKFVWENKMPAFGASFPKPYSCARSTGAASISHLKYYHRIIGSFQHEPIRWNALQTGFY